MGNYITQEDIEKKIGVDGLIQLTDDYVDGVVNTDNMNQAITDAEGEVDSYLAKQYSVPLSSPPAIVKAICLDIVIYHLWGRRKSTPEDIEKRYTNAIRFLEKVAKDQVSLGVDTEPTASPNEGGPASTKTDEDRIFTDDTLQNY